MRRLGFTAVMVLLVTPALGQEWAKKMFKTTEHDFGTVAKGAKAEFDFVLSNVYMEDVHIVSARSSCGCTSVRVAKPDLKTYEEGAIHATFNTPSFQGQRAATLTIVLDKPFAAEVQLHVKGNIRGDVILDPGSVQMGEVTQGAPREQKVIVYHTGQSNWGVTTLKTSNPFVTAGMREIARQDGQVWYEMTVRLSPKAPVGYLNDHLLLTTNDPQPAHIPLLVEGRVVPMVTVSPALLNMGTVQPGKEVTKNLVIKGNKPFRILSITCGDQSFKFGKERDEGAKPLHIVPVTFAAGTNLGKVSKTIRIETDLSDSAPELAAFAVVGAP
jgi:hypothetical protein